MQAQDADRLVEPPAELAARGSPELLGDRLGRLDEHLRVEKTLQGLDLGVGRTRESLAALHPVTEQPLPPRDLETVDLRVARRLDRDPGPRDDDRVPVAD